MENHIEEYDAFVSRMAKMRELSSPAIYDIDDSVDYSRRLKDNFEVIGKLAEENRKMLEDILFPILESRSPLSEAQVAEMTEFAEKLLSLAGDVTDFENLDLPIMTLIAQRLVGDADGKGDIAEQVRHMDLGIMAYYSLMNMTKRIFPCPEISDKYRRKGLEMGDFFMKMIDKDHFLTIEDVSIRESCLTNARFSTSFYEGSTRREDHEKMLDTLEKMEEIAQDPFYREAVPDFDWNYFLFRTYGYLLQCTDMGNDQKFEKDHLERIVKAADAIEKLMDSDPEYFCKINMSETIPFLCARNRYLTGRITEEEYLSVLMETYEKRDPKSYEVDSSFANLLLPMEGICLMEGKRLSAKQQFLLKKYYQNVIAFMFNLPNPGILSFALEHFAGLVLRFIEVPGGITFEEFGLQTLAALHPPTYIHSRMVGQIAVRLATYLIDSRPELFLGICGAADCGEVMANKEKILSFTYHAALTHDFGKIFIIDTVFVYGRRLLDEEFGIIKTHPLIGYELLKKHESTKEYAEVALAHHRFYDDSKGYPQDFKTAESPLKTIIDIIQCADCMDAATDSVGRSYNKGKTIDYFINEVRGGSGTRYAPWLAELFERDDVRADMDFLLTTGRQETYIDTYVLLKNVKEKG